ncbi:MAG: helix-turn-helix transcriptional regulator [Nocardioides sp.]
MRDLGAHRHLVVSERLRERRRDLGLTQKEVVSRLRRIGVDTTNKALSSLEHGAGLDVAKLPELACALDCTLTYLLGLTDDPGRWRPDPGQWPEAPRRLPPAPAPATPPSDDPARLPRILGPVNADWSNRHR